MDVKSDSTHLNASKGRDDGAEEQKEHHVSPAFAGTSLMILAVVSFLLFLFILMAFVRTIMAITA